MINDLLLKVISFDFFKAKQDANKIQWDSFDSISKLQEDKFLRLISHARRNVPYYSKVLKNHSFSSIKDLQKIPFLSKELIRKKNSQLRATNLPKSRFKKNSTSGSTGAAMHFYSDKKTDVKRHACSIRGDSWTGWSFGEPIVIIWGALIDTNKSKGFKDKLINSPLLFNTTILSSFNMKESDIERYIKIINKKKPQLIIGYPSSLEYFSKYIIKKGIQVYKPRGVITGGESLHDYQRNTIQTAFKSMVLNRYGCRDVGHIANECEKQNGLHISMDHVIVEVVNKKGDICKPGEIGEVVVTDLDNFAFPFIRYKIGDIAIQSNKTCSCGRGFSLLEKVEGRSFDLIIGTNGNRVPGTYFTLLTRNRLKNIIQFQIIQKEISTILLNIIVNKGFGKKEEKIIDDLFKEKLGQDTQIQIEIVDSIPTTKSGKFRWVISEIGK
jgi:phenylacetate-CoA ligase